MQYALHLSICVTSFCVDLAVSHLLLTSVAIIHECTVEDTFPFEKSSQPHRKAHLDKNTYRSYLNGDKIYLNSTLFWDQFACCLLVELLGCDIHKYGPRMTDVKDIEQICILVLSYSEPEGAVLCQHKSTNSK